MSRGTSGFTLIEVLLALAIFTIIGISTARHLQQIVSTKQAAFANIDFYNSLRAAISLIRDDISQSFHIKYEDLAEENRTALQQNQQTAHTLFDGRKSELIFTSLSHRVYYLEKRECVQTEISYFLQKKPGHKLSSLMKRESELIDGDLYQGGKVLTLLDDVASLQFQYWDEKQDKWVDDWNSDGGATQDRFPLAVRVKLSVGEENAQKLDVDTQFKLSFPNNENPFKKL